MEKILKAWLFQQCEMLPGSTHAVLLTAPPGKEEDCQAILWPEDHQGFAVLSRVAKAAFHEKKAVVRARNNQREQTGEPMDAIACPLFLNERMYGVVAIEITGRSQALQTATVQQVQTGAKWLESLVSQHTSTAGEQLVNLVDLVATALEHEQFQIAATGVVNELSQRFSCHRVSLGFLRHNRVRLEAMSHTTRIDHHSNRVRAIEDAMGEALDQGTTMSYPETSNTAVLATRFHAHLFQVLKGTAVCTVPLVKNSKPVGALLLERSLDNPFSPETITQCEQVGLLIGPVLETRRRDERFLLLKILESFQNMLAKLLGPRHLSVKLAVCLAALLLIWLNTAGTMFNITCDSILEASIRRLVVAPQQGYLAKAVARAGDLVQKGDLLATLDDQSLLLEHRKWQSQHSQVLKQYRKALAQSDRAEVAILNAQRLQAEAQLQLIEHQLARTELVAPFSGLVVKGDLSQALGAPVTRGEVLYEIAPVDEYRVILKVDERDIRLVAVGQKGQLKLSGIPDKTIHITIDRVTPVSSASDGRNYFSVEAFMDSPSDLIRPGMEGVSKIQVSQKKIIWVWTRRLVNWVRVFAFSHLPWGVS